MSDVISTAEAISLGAAAVSALSAAVALVQGRRAYRLAKKQEARKTPSITYTYHNATYSYENGEGFLKILVTIDNRSELNNSVRNARLNANYILDNTPVTLSIDHSISEGIPITNNLLEIPLRLGGYDSQKGWIQFHLKGELARRMKLISKFSVTLEDGFSNEFTIDVLKMGS